MLNLIQRREGEGTQSISRLSVANFKVIAVKRIYKQCQGVIKTSGNFFLFQRKKNYYDV